MAYQRLRDLREDRDLLQRQVAERLRCSQRVYSNYERGERDIPTDILIRLSEFYDVLNIRNRFAYAFAYSVFFSPIVFPR